MKDEGLPLPPKPEWLSKPKQPGWKLNGPRDCESIEREIARLQGDLTKYHDAAARAQAKSQQEAQLARQAYDNWQTEEKLWHDASQAAQNAKNPDNKAFQQQAAGQHWWKAKQEEASYQTHKKNAADEAEYAQFNMRMAERTVEQIEKLRREAAACKDPKVSGNDGAGNSGGLGPNVPLGGSYKSGGLGPNVPLGGSYKFGGLGPDVPLGGSYKLGGVGPNVPLGGSNYLPNFPLGEDMHKDDAPKSPANEEKKVDQSPKVPGNHGEPKKKVSALPNMMGGPAFLGDVYQNTAAPDFRAYFASRARMGGGMQSVTVQQDSFAEIRNRFGEIRQSDNAAAEMGATLQSRAAAGSGSSTITTVTMPAVQPKTVQTMPQNPTVERMHAPIDSLGVSNFGGRISPRHFMTR